MTTVRAKIYFVWGLIFLFSLHSAYAESEQHGNAAGGGRETSGAPAPLSSPYVALTLPNRTSPSGIVACQGTFAFKKERSDKQCDYGILTAAHCFGDSGSQIPASINNFKFTPRKLDASGNWIDEPRITTKPGKQIDIVVGQNYGNGLLKTQDGGTIDNGNGIDAAWIFFPASCDLVPENVIAEMDPNAAKTPTNSSLQLRHDNDEELQRSTSFGHVNGVLAGASRTNTKNGVIRISNKEPSTIVGGNSGGAITKKVGDKEVLVGVTSSVDSTGPANNGQNAFVQSVFYNRFGISWALAALNQRFGVTTNTPPPPKPNEQQQETERPPEGTHTTQVPPPPGQERRPATTNPTTPGTPLDSEAEIEWHPEGMWGKDVNGNKVPLVINNKTGELLGGERGEFQIPESAKKKLHEYVTEHPERFSDAEKALLKPFIDNREGKLPSIETKPEQGSGQNPPPREEQETQPDLPPQVPYKTAPPLLENTKVVPMSSSFSDGSKQQCVGTPVLKQNTADPKVCYYSFAGSDSCFASRSGTFNSITVGNLNLELTDLQISSKARDQYNVSRRHGPLTPHYNYDDNGILLSFQTSCDWLPGNPRVVPPQYFDTGKPSTSEGETLFAKLPNGSNVPLLLNFNLPGWSFTPRNGANLSGILPGTPIYNQRGGLIGITSKNHGNRLEIDPYTSKWITGLKPKVPVVEVPKPPARKPDAEINPGSSQRQNPPATQSEPPSATRQSVGTLSPKEFSHIVGQKCNTCHSTGKNGAPHFPDYIMDWEKWNSKMQQGDPVALSWLSRFKEMTVDSNAMLENAKMGEADRAAFKDFVLRASKGHGDSSSSSSRERTQSPAATGTALQKPNPNAIKLTNPDSNAGYYNVLAGIPTQDPNLRQLLSNFDIIYDKTGVIEAHQFPYQGTTQGVGARPLKLSPNPSAPAPYILNPNRTWKAPFTTGFGMNDEDTSVGSFFLISLPKDASGRSKKMVTYYTDMPPDPFGGRQAKVEHTIYPAGTQVAEVRYKNLKMPNGEIRSFVFEIETRTKDTKQSVNGKYFSQWNPISYRPYGNEADFLKAAEKNISQTEYADLANYVSTHRGKATITSDMGPLLRDVQGNPTSTLSGNKTSLPNNLSNEAVAKLFMEKPLVPVKGEQAWSLSDGPFPKSYHGGAIPVTTQSCAGCHSSSNTAFSQLLPSTRQFTNQYGMTPGSDGVLSFHRWDPKVLAGFTSSTPGQEMRKPRAELAGLYESYSASKHSDAEYTPFAQ